MSKYVELFNYLRQCPQLKDLWSIGATEDAGVKFIMPAGTSPKFDYDEHVDVTGSYECDILPFPSVYEDFQINAYYYLDTQSGKAPEDCLNILELDEAQSICDWINEQGEKGNLPQITGKKVVNIETRPFNPQVRATDTANNLVAYFVTVRIHYVNTATQRSVYYE